MNSKAKDAVFYTIISPAGVKMYACLELIPSIVKTGNKHALQITINDDEDTVMIYNVTNDDRFNTKYRFRLNADAFMRSIYDDTWTIYNEWSWIV